ncbi:hypothetical protein J23TS9_56560 [Paenibacillus sp. J23TS9]|uniref:hypothetical protein n=1 Tax=Paenibacillus sp. J23TS9 TaxID=2807193 RepID=UPI001B0D1580|nr:hypothetical protein [Paenibacillus sp. J23TS9]GIP30526.1 hypothetical protein J23TS9_56560 [Paenibacillus sp. J23TS9]
MPTEEELKRYYEVVWRAKNFQDMMIMITLMYTGVRVSELISIKLADIDEKEASGLFVCVLMEKKVH